MVEETNNHWVFKKHTKNINNLIQVALYLKSNKSGISTKEKNKMYSDFKKNSIYNPRISIREEPLDSINHRIDFLKYYMFGYADKINNKNKFIFSPLGNLFLKNLDKKDNLSKIFSTMLFGTQFPHPASKPSEKISLYPFRLIFSLLLDSRLKGRLYHYEVVRFIIYTKKITPKIYEDLVESILNSRKKTDTEKFDYLKSNEHTLTKSVYEWQYYVSSILHEMNIIKKNDGDKYVYISHPPKKKSKSQPTKRKANNGYFSLSDIVSPLVKELLKEYSIYEEPLKLNNSNKTSDDIVKEIYSFYPEQLLNEIGEIPSPLEVELLKLPKLIERYSENPNNKSHEKFEEILEEAFNMFVNIEAKKLSGPGNTDIECLYLDKKEKFAVEAKSTTNKLIQINAGRLKRHRELIGAKYTIVITPRYVPSVKYDIDGQNVVIIKANTLSEYLHNNIIFRNRNIDYTEIKKIIDKNMGTDISSNISDLTLTKFG